MGVDARVTMHRRHVVLLGAGASLAAFPNGDANGLRIPLMADFVHTVEGLADYLARNGIEHNGNIEDLYSTLVMDNTATLHVKHIEMLIWDYFSRLTMPDEPTLYDHLLLCLRSKDMVATFNWDPFLYRAFCRVGRIIGEEYLPQLAFLHGSVAIGFCQAACHERIMVGPADHVCRCGGVLRSSPLLYPIRNKDYATDPSIRASWSDLRTSLKDAYLFTVFGYSAPSSDVEAVKLMKDAWGELGQRTLEEVEIIDTLGADAVEAKWQAFIYNGHVATWSCFAHSFMARHPRRSCDAFWNMTMDLTPRHEAPIDTKADWSELSRWVVPYLEAEKA